MPGYNLAEMAHCVSLLPPQDINGGVTGLAFSMADAAHVSIIIAFGVMGTAVPTAILLNQCTDASGSNPSPIGFRYYFQSASGAGGDVLDGGTPPNYATSEGIVAFPTTVANLMYILEVDAAELEAQAAVVGTITELPYLQVQITDGGNDTYASIIAVLSGGRFVGRGSPSVTV